MNLTVNLAKDAHSATLVSNLEEMRQYLNELLAFSRNVERNARQRQCLSNFWNVLHEMIDIK